MLIHKDINVNLQRIEMAKKLKEMNENSDKEGDMLGKAADDGPLVTAIKQRWVRHCLLSNKVRNTLGNQTKVNETWFNIKQS